MSTSIEAETNRPAERGLMLAEILAALARAVRRSACRKVRCYSERLAAAGAVSAGARVEWDSPRASSADARKTSTGTARCSCASAEESSEWSREKCDGI